MNPSTSPSLLGRLADVADKEAWDRFYHTYAPVVLDFVRQSGGSSDMACDVLQEAMVCVLRLVPRFRYDAQKGRFRSVLLKIVSARLRDAYRRERRYQVLESGSQAQAWFERIPNGTEDASLVESWDRLWDSHLLVQAMARVRDRANRQTFRCFELYVLERQPMAEVSAETGLQPNVIYQHRARILRMLRQEIQRLKQELGE